MNLFNGWEETRLMEVLLLVKGKPFFQSSLMWQNPWSWSQKTQSQICEGCALCGAQPLVARFKPQILTAWLFCTSARQAVFRKWQNNFHSNRLSGVRRTETRAPCATSVFTWCISYCLSYHLLLQWGLDLSSDIPLCPNDGSIEIMPFLSVFSHRKVEGTAFAL